MGMCHGIVGKIKFLPESPVNLVLISEVAFVCRIHGGDVSILVSNYNFQFSVLLYRLL